MYGPHRADSPVKLLALLLLLLNSPSLPFLWHLRVWRYPLKFHLKLFAKGRKQGLLQRDVEGQKAGGIKMKSYIHRIAWFDDCDWNLHLSNSFVSHMLTLCRPIITDTRCYAKNLDAARMKWCISAMAPLLVPGGGMALGASHYVFIKEIPLGAHYTIETKLGGWGEKWMYLVSEFVIYPGGSAKGKTTRSAVTTSPKGNVTAEGEAGTSSPEGSKLESVGTAVTSLRAREPRADGGVTCAVIVSEYCVKINRVTVPPVCPLLSSPRHPLTHLASRNALRHDLSQ